MTRERLKELTAKWSHGDWQPEDQLEMTTGIIELQDQVAELLTVNAALRNFANPCKTTDAEDRFFEEHPHCRASRADDWTGD